MPSIQKTKSGSYKAVVRKTSGQRPVVKAKSFPSRREALRWAVDLEDSIDNGSYFKKEEDKVYIGSLGDLLTEYEAIYTKEKKTAYIERRRLRMLENHFPDLWNAPLHTFSVEDLNDFVRERKKKGNLLTLQHHGKHKDLASNSIRLDILLISNAFRRANKLGFGKLENPVKDSDFDLPPPSEERDRIFETKVGSLNEEKEFLKALAEHPNPEFKAMCYLAMLTSLRKGNLVNLCRSQINEDDNHIKIDKKHSKNDTEFYIPLSDEIQNALNAYFEAKEAWYLRRIVDAEQSLETKLENSQRFTKQQKKLQRAQQALDNWQNSDRIFTLSVSGLDSAWKRFRQELMEKGCLIDFRFHDLRRVAITRFFGMGFSIPQVASISSHKDWKMLQRYTNIKNTADLAKEINKKLKATPGQNVESPFFPNGDNG